MVYFPVFVILAWIADRHRLLFKCLHKGYRADKSIVDAMEGDQESAGTDVAMGEGWPDGSLFLGNSCSETVTGWEVEPSRDEAGEPLLFCSYHEINVFQLHVGEGRGHP